MQFPAVAHNFFYCNRVCYLRSRKGNFLHDALYISQFFPSLRMSLDLHTRRYNSFSICPYRPQIPTISSPKNETTSAISHAREGFRRGSVAVLRK